MSEEQKRKIEDVMHTLAVIRDGKAVNCRASAKACYEVLDEVLHMEEPVNASEAKEPAPKEVEKERPHQADCICRRCEDWDDAHEPAKVEAGDALSKLEEMRKTVASTLPKHNYGPDVTLSLIDQLKSALEENERLKGLLREIEGWLRGNGYPQRAELVKAAVTGAKP